MYIHNLQEEIIFYHSKMENIPCVFFINRYILPALNLIFTDPNADTLVEWAPPDPHRMEQNLRNIICKIIFSYYCDLNIKGLERSIGNEL